MIPATATVVSPALGVLFDEVPLSATVTSKAWLYFGLYMLAGLMAAAICAYIAITRGSAALPWFGGWYGIYYFILLIAGVAIPSLYAVFIILNESSVIEDYIKTAQILKGATIAGMIVILSTRF